MKDSEMDIVYDIVDTAMRQGDFETIIRGYNDCSDDIDECITWLSASIPFKDTLREERKPLIEKVTKLLIENGEDPKGALIGIL